MIRKYLKNCRYLFPVYGRYEHQFLHNLKKQIVSYLAEFPDTTYEELTEQFGLPTDVVISYYDSVDESYLLEKTNFVKKARLFCICLICLAIGILGYRSYDLYQEYLEAKDSCTLYEYVTIIDEGDIEDEE